MNSSTEEKALDTERSLRRVEEGTKDAHSCATIGEVRSARASNGDHVYEFFLSPDIYTEPLDVVDHVRSPEPCYLVGLHKSNRTAAAYYRPISINSSKKSTLDCYSTRYTNKSQVEGQQICLSATRINGPETGCSLLSYRPVNTSFSIINHPVTQAIFQRVYMLFSESLAFKLASQTSFDRIGKKRQLYSKILKKSIINISH
ncbi:hypothetical protein J6590_000686 [Homalodisca vitripennis]|nr:hypothetical protein J6590_000686 [Homalodisca vitripennis]